MAEFLVNLQDLKIASTREIAEFPRGTTTLWDFQVAYEHDALLHGTHTFLIVGLPCRARAVHVGLSELTNNDAKYHAGDDRYYVDSVQIAADGTAIRVLFRLEQPPYGRAKRKTGIYGFVSAQTG